MPGAMPWARKASRISARHVVPVGRVHDAEVRRLRVPHGEAGVVLGGEDHVLDARQLGQRGPILRARNLRGLKVFGSSVKNRLDVGFVGPHQRMRNHHAGLAVNRPVDEQAESLVVEPFQPLGLVQ